MIVPNGNTMLREGDHITVIGQPESLEKLYTQYGPGASTETNKE